MKRIGIVGGGQLARMLALAGRPLGLEFSAIDPAPDACAGAVARLIVAEYGDASALARLAVECDVVTYEFENLSANALDGLSAAVPVRPGTRSLLTSQDRLVEKSLFGSIGLPTAPHRPVDNPADLDKALRTLGCPAILKTRRLGYDGKGQALIRAPEDARKAWDAVAGDRSNSELILEGFVRFKSEVSQISCRGADGSLVHYPLAENVHAGGILRRSIPLSPTVAAPWAAPARAAMERLMLELGHVGILCIEFFVTADGLVANEMAPRVHNSGHWSLDGGGVSQFENHVRAVAGLPLGNPEPSRPVLMVNLIGSMPDPIKVLSLPFVRLHDYAKEPRSGRKVGHLNILPPPGADPRACLAAVAPLVSEETRAAMLGPIPGEA